MASTVRSTGPRPRRGIGGQFLPTTGQFDREAVNHVMVRKQDSGKVSEGGGPIFDNARDLNFFDAWVLGIFHFGLGSFDKAKCESRAFDGCGLGVVTAEV